MLSQWKEGLNFEVRALIFSFGELRKVKVSQKPNILRDWNTLVITKTN
jgi:hypothetical protein